MYPVMNQNYFKKTHKLDTWKIAKNSCLSGGNMWADGDIICKNKTPIKDIVFS